MDTKPMTDLSGAGRITNRLTPGTRPAAEADPRHADKQRISYEFERLFAKQWVSQMTEGLFGSMTDGPLSGPPAMYESMIQDALSDALAQKEVFGIGSKIRSVWEDPNR